MKALVVALLSLDLHAAFAQDPGAVPEGYYNARHATDGQPPQPATVPGELRSYSTEQSIGIEWELAGDTNHNAACRVDYRTKGAADWRAGFPLFRVDYFGWYDQKTARRAFNMVAGSIMFLEPGTEYEVRLTLADPDGGSTEKLLSIATRPEPALGQPLRTLHLKPGATGGDGSEARPWGSIAEASLAAKPGDLFLLHAGSYGACELTGSGDAAHYIAWKAAGDGDAVLDQLRLPGTARVWLEGLHFVRPLGGEGDGPTGLRPVAPSPECVVKRCDFRGFHYSIMLEKGSDGWHISDNEIAGDKPTGISGEGIELNHTRDQTVCYNHIHDVADGISYPDGNCDLFCNDIHDASDDGIECDYGYANTRIWGNRLSTTVGCSFQPMYCGPWYFIRNQIVALHSVFKLRVQDRFLCVNNTFAAWSDRGLAQHAQGFLTSYCRNNVWIHLGGSEALWVVNAPSGAKYRDYQTKYTLYDSFKADWRTDVDYDGFEWSATTPPPKQQPQNPVIWNGKRITTIEDLAKTVGIEAHGRQLDRARTFAEFDLPPAAATYRQPLILAAGGDAIDAGVPVPNFSETFTGQAPDLGAFEFGQPVPHVGPR